MYVALTVCVCPPGFVVFCLFCFCFVCLFWGVFFVCICVCRVINLSSWKLTDELTSFCDIAMEGGYPDRVRT